MQAVILDLWVTRHSSSIWRLRTSTSSSQDPGGGLQAGSSPGCQVQCGWQLLHDCRTGQECQALEPQQGKTSQDLLRSWIRGSGREGILWQLPDRLLQHGQDHHVVGRELGQLDQEVARSPGRGQLRGLQRGLECGHQRLGGHHSQDLGHQVQIPGSHTDYRGVQGQCDQSRCEWSSDTGGQCWQQNQT